MKKIILSLLTISALSSIYAQSIEVTVDTPVPSMNTVDLNTTKDFEGFHVKNIGAETIEVRINRLVNNITAGHETYFCWEYCYDPSASISGGATNAGMPIMVGETKDNFTFHINANGIEGCGHVVMRFFNKKNANDYVEQVFDYCTPNGNWNALSISNEINPEIVLSAPVPNPANEAALVKVELPRNADNTYLAVRDLAGREISRVAIETTTAEVSVPTAQLSAGLYYLSLMAEGEVLATQKLVVTH